MDDREYSYERKPFSDAMIFALRITLAALLSTNSIACLGSTPEPAGPAQRSPAFGFAIQPRPCAAGSNLVSAAAFVTDGGRTLRYLAPRDGLLTAELLDQDGSARAAEVDWLETSAEQAKAAATRMRWNLRLRFDSPHEGPCFVRIAFQPTPDLVDDGVIAAGTTVLLTDPPPPPPR